MKINNINYANISKNENLNSRFLKLNIKELKMNCHFYKGDFFIDSLNYFPITQNNESFLELFAWKNKTSYKKFFTEKFYKQFNKNKENFKTFNNTIVLGSSHGSNYYRNLLTFIPRIFFISEKKIKIAIHRKTSNNFRKFIENILKERNIELKEFIFLDDDFYFFENSLMPQFFPGEKISIKILNHFFKKDNNEKNRIYVSRKNAFYRKIVNESDLINELKQKKFKIIDLETLSIEEQISVFSSAEIVIGATGSALANIVFCREGTKIFEIAPSYNFNFELGLKKRFSKICKVLGLEYNSMIADPVQVNEIDESTKKFIDNNILEKSNYYKNLIVKKENFKNFLDKI